MKSLRSSTAIRRPARTLVRVIPAEATVLPPAQGGSPSVGGARRFTMPLASAPPVALCRLTRILLLVAVALSLGAPTAGAVPAKKLDNNLGAMWTTILQTPTPDNPFVTGGCYNLGGTVAPFGLNGFDGGTCPVKPGTKIFVAASAVECSTLEPPPSFGADEKALRDCAQTALNNQDETLGVPTVTLDDKPVPVTLVETPLLNIDLPPDNILERPETQGLSGLSVGRGWVALLHPLTPGQHDIVIKFNASTITTTIDVRPALSLNARGGASNP